MTATARSPRPLPLTEKAFQRQVVQLAKLLGWDFIYHAQLSKWSERGWPDLVMIRTRDRRLLFVELKAEKGKLSDRQEAVLDYLRFIQQIGDRSEYGRPSIEVHVWRPSDFDGIEQVLR